MKQRQMGMSSRLAAAIAAVSVAGLLALGAAPASAAPNIDPAAEGSITVHKLEQPPTPGTVGDGTEIDTTGMNPLGGVTFTAQQVESIDLSTNAGWAAADGLVAADVLGDAEAYPLGAADTATTGAIGTPTAGEAVFGGLPIGVYLVTETSTGANPVALPAQPFLVSIPQAIEGDDWLYDVNVYPKNSLIDVAKEVVDTDARGIGDQVAWTIDTFVPYQSEGNTLSAFAVIDQLSVEQLAFVSATVTLGETSLTAGTDYALTSTGGLVVVEMSGPGLLALNAAGGQTLAVTITSEIIAVGDGSIENTAAVFVNDPERMNGFVSNEAVSYWGALQITKTAAGSTELLDGAVFEVYDTAGALVEVDGETRFTTVDGVVVIPGLRTTLEGVTYTLREVEAPLGYIIGGTGDYEVTVLPSSLAAPNTTTIENAQAPAFQLPITGGDGQIAFLIGGGALLLIGIGVVLVVARRRGTHKA
ncbi:SpaH/EbpB family LPXTG-anchored major pilin [Agrococcus sp. Marseille-P2731]|uniref:SpaH/EbpB family LPXTG-anchored major pilin n=1 Tax=Agrococcus sp. Marseille-P2731 TaxID=1841862 RepID=UPI0009F9F9BF|nr:SpaH/EbpB family LPXTG-anchored major pilin [Agrococcus sp. Marseille-P2731]